MNRSIAFLFALTLGFAVLLPGCAPESSSGKEQHSPSASRADDPSPIPDSLLLSKGMEITTEAFQKLSGSLKRAMADGGVPAAVPYCNMMAWPLLDTVAQANGVKIRRTALRYRNPSNKPRGADMEMLETFASGFSAGNPPQPILTRHDGGSVVFYRPILLQEGCLPCHGSPGKDVAEADLELIRGLYPQDQAIDFKPGDLRGMWVVENLEKAIPE